MVCFLSILRLSNFKPYMTVVTCFIPSPLPAHISGYILLLLMPRFLFQPELRIICRTSCWSDGFCVEIYTYQDEFPVDILIWAALFLLCTSLVYYVLLDNRYLVHFPVLLLYSLQYSDIQYVHSCQSPLPSHWQQLSFSVHILMQEIQFFVSIPDFTFWLLLSHSSDPFL